MSALVATGLTAAFDGRVIFENLSLTCAAGEITVVMGASGCGKTTLLRALAGLIATTHGTITMGSGDDAPIAYMPQGDSLLPWLSVQQNILVPLTVGRRKQRVENSDLAAAQTLLEGMNIGTTAALRPSALSGGMRQRVALARSMITAPELLLLDEPFSALDEVARLALERYVRDFVDLSGAACIFVTHSVDQALAIGDSICFMAARPAQIARIDTIPRNVRPLPAAEYGARRARLLEHIHA